MSFILDALKKLEREKETRGAGVVMVGPVQWGGPDRQRQRRRLILATVGLVVLVGALLWLAARPTPGPAAPSPPVATTAPVDSVPTPIVPTAEPLSAPPLRSLNLPVSPPAQAPGDGGAGDEGEEAPAVTEPERAPSRLDELSSPVPPPAPASDTPEYRLTAISEREGEPVALLNDRLVHEGDSIGNLRIIRIGPTEIEIEVDGERRTVGF